MRQRGADVAPDHPPARGDERTLWTLDQTGKSRAAKRQSSSQPAQSHATFAANPPLVGLLLPQIVMRFDYVTRLPTIAAATARC